MANRHSPIPPKCRPIAPKQPVFSVFHSMGLQFGGHTLKSRTRATTREELHDTRAECAAVDHVGRHHSGGIARHEGPTRRRHAIRRLRVVQNPHRRRCGVHQQARKAWPRYPQTTATPSPSKFRMQFKNTSDIALQTNTDYHNVGGELHAKLPRSSQDTAPYRGQAPLVWRAPDGPEGLAAGPVGGGGAWQGFEATHKHTSAHQAPLVWRAPEGPDGLAGVPVGGGRAWPGFKTTRRAKLAARTARGRAAAHGHTKQPGPTGNSKQPGPAGKARRSSPLEPCARAGASRPGRSGCGPRCAAPRLRCR